MQTANETNNIGNSSTVLAAELVACRLAAAVASSGSNNNFAAGPLNEEKQNFLMGDGNFVCRNISSASSSSFVDIGKFLETRNVLF